MHLRKYLLCFSFFWIACGQPDKTFTVLSSGNSGIDFNNYLEESEELNVLNYTYFYNGGGVAAGDLNNDGLPDLVFTGNMVRNKLFINKGGLKFEDRTTTSGIADKQGWCTGVTLVDINADGWLDIYICRSADTQPDKRANLLFINNKDLTFSEQAAQYGLADQGYSTQSAFFDYDRDGDLDAVIINHSLKKYTTGTMDNPEVRQEQNPFFASKLYRNDAGKFTDVSQSAGITSNVLSFGLGVVVSDFNNDQWPDFFISNDFNEPDYLFINQRDGTFKEDATTLLGQHSLYSMGADAADINDDGLTDLITLDMLPESNFDQKMHSGAENFEKFRYLFSRGFYNQYSRNMLHLNNGYGQFSEIGQLSGISNTDWSWSALLKDFDNDGREDLFVTNGYVRDYTDMDFIKYSFERQVDMQQNGAAGESMMEYISNMPGHPLSNYMFRNEGDYSFKNISKEWGFDLTGVYSGATTADLDGDGDLDLITSATNAEAGVFINQSPTKNGNKSLRISLQGDGLNKAGIGAVIQVYSGTKIQKQEHYLTRGFQSSVEPVLHFGMGRSDKADSISITWPDGSRQLVKNVPTGGSIIRFNQSEATKTYTSASVPLKPIFLEKKEELTIIDERYQNDFSIQSTLNNFISNVSPVISVADINKDGFEDIVVGATRMQSTWIKYGSKNGVHRVDSISDKNGSPVSSVVLSDLNGDGYLEIITGRNTFGAAVTGGNTLSVYKNKKGKGFQLAHDFPSVAISNVGCIAVESLQSDRVSRIFTGSRIMQQIYPLSEPSVLQVFDEAGNFIRTEELPDNGMLGMMTGAVFIDLNGDNQNELVTAGEWTPIRVFVRKGIKWTDETKSFSEFSGSGWWCSLFKADLDGDGDEDLVAGNYGLNTQFIASAINPLKVLSKDFDGNGKRDAITSYYINGISYPSHSLDDLLEQLPLMKKRFSKYSAYANIDMTKLFSANEQVDALELEANEMRTVVLENTGKGKLILHDLPVEAQFSPVFAIAAPDLDNDGKRELVLGGNQSGTRIKFGKYDANVGFVFHNKGGMNFTLISPANTGISIRGDVRSVAYLKDEEKLIFGVNGGKIQSFKHIR
jgi:hypothetical protein